MDTGNEPTSPDSEIYFKAMSRRLEYLKGDRPYHYIADITGLSFESARRTVQRGNPHPDFLERVCLATKCSTDWLLLGRGPVWQEEARLEVIQSARLSQLGHALGLALERIDIALAKAGLSTQHLGSIEVKPNPPSPAPHDPKGTKGPP